VLEAMLTDPAAPSNTPVTKSFWILAVLALLWNAMGAFDYLMTQTGNEAYLSSFTPEQLAYFNSFPAWAVSAWAIAVWGAVLGCILLLLRKKAAVPVFLVSFVAMVLTTIYNFLLSDGLEYMGGAFELMFSALIFFVALALWRWSAKLAARGVLG
jgi:hypothetical protein